MVQALSVQGNGVVTSQFGIVIHPITGESKLHGGNGLWWSGAIHRLPQSENEVPVMGSGGEINVIINHGHG